MKRTLAGVAVLAVAALLLSCPGNKCDPGACNEEHNSPDAGEPEVDAGLQPDSTDGGALDLVVVADETSFAPAWTALQDSDVATWTLFSRTNGNSTPLLAIPDAGTKYATISQAGELSLFVYGFNASDVVAVGKVATQQSVDGGSGCLANSDCAIDRVCNLGGQCTQLSCTSGAICPSGYVCDTQNTRLCQRTSNGPGTLGNGDGGFIDRPLPLISEEVTAHTGPLQTHEAAVTAQPAEQDPDIVGVDSARQVVTVQQFGQIYAWSTQTRGKSWSVSPIDPLGQHPKVTWNAKSKTVFVCYQAGSAIRVRASHDLAHSWVENVAEIANAAPTDGGVERALTECDIAPWLSGGALVAVVDADGIRTYAVDSAANLGAKLTAFTNESNVGTTTVYGAQRVALGTSPDEGIGQLVFTGTRNQSIATDRDVYAVTLDPARTGGVWSARQRITSGSGLGQPNDQDFASVAVEPGTGRAVAAYMSQESSSTGGLTTSVYLSLFTQNAQNQWVWGTGSDLSVFAQNNAGSYIVMTDRPSNGAAWDAITPSVGILGNGKIFLAFGAGPSGAPATPYTIFADFTRQSPISTAKGWFIPPAQRVSGTPIVNFGGSKLAGPYVSGDAQISGYVTYIEGSGAQNDLPNRPIVLSTP